MILQMGGDEHRVETDEVGGTAPLGQAELAELGEQLLRVSSRRSVRPEGSRLDASAFRILWRLSVRPLTMKELSEQLGLEQSTVNRQVNAALGAGLVERFDDDGSAAKRLRPTAGGLDAFYEDGAARTAAIQPSLDTLGAERLRLLIGLLGEFNDAMDAALRDPA